MTDVVGLLLAAGRSQRFGCDKRSHRLADGTPMALESARRLKSACLHSLVVLRQDDLEWARLFEAEGLRCIWAERADAGMGNSLAAGVEATPEGGGWLVALADMPCIAASSYLAVLHALDQGAGIARPCHQSKPGHPVGFSTAYRNELLALTGDEGGRSIIARHPQALVRCDVDDAGVLIDVDRPNAV